MFSFPNSSLLHLFIAPPFFRMGAAADALLGSLVFVPVPSPASRTPAANGSPDSLRPATGCPGSPTPGHRPQLFQIRSSCTSTLPGLSAGCCSASPDARGHRFARFPYAWSSPQPFRLILPEDHFGLCLGGFFIFYVFD